jgi:Leucine-rich repeat (LRR) protein
MARNPAADSARARFAALLAAHLANGTRPATAAGEPWTDAEFAGEVRSTRDDVPTVSPRSVSNWRKGTALPVEIEPILRALFGPSDRHAAAREELRLAFLAARAEKFAHAKPDPAGPTWVAKGDQLAIDRTTTPSDAAAAANPVRQQLQRAIAGMASDLVAPAKRLENTRTWGRLSATAEKFGAVVACDPATMPERLGDAYALLLPLGRFLETDVRVQRDPLATDGPLDPDIHGLLSDMVRLAAPWLRGFPTVAAMDDAAGKFLARMDLIQPAREFVRVARAQNVLSERDAAEMEELGEAADADDFQGQKAGNRAVGGAKNLMLAAAGVLATFLSGAVASDFATRSLLVQRAGATLATAADEVQAVAETLPDDLRHALLALVAEGKRVDLAAPMLAPAAPEPPVPKDVEQQARAMILAGQAPPASWRLLIRDLDLSPADEEKAKSLAGDPPQPGSAFAFRRTDLLADLTAMERLNLGLTQVSDIAPLANLTALEYLQLSNTLVSDIAPLADLSTLQDLWLDDTRVGDITPLARLADLRTLWLNNTLVINLAPLAGLSRLQYLTLNDTAVSDISPITGFAFLKYLWLNNTKVKDISAVERLTALETLWLNNTRVSDIAALAALTDLQSLWLNSTQVGEISAVAKLTALQNIHMSDTQVSNIAPLAELAELKDLWLDNTKVSDVAPLARLAALQILRLGNTPVSDIAPLAHLTTMQELYLHNTHVSDIAPLAGLSALQSLDLENTQVSDIAPLAGLSALRHLLLKGTRVSDVSALAHIRGLTIRGFTAPAGRKTGRRKGGQSGAPPGSPGRARR